MKHFYFVKIFTLLLLLTTEMAASLQSKSAIVYYGNDISYATMGVHDYIIIDPDHVKVHTSGFKTYKNDIYAYVSINELYENRSYAKDIDDSWIIGSNDAWKSSILDISNKQYQNFLLDKVIGKLHKKGFKNFFFDTLDSYKLIQSTEKQEKLKSALVQFIKRFKKKFPKSKLIINRGFDIIDKVHPYIEALLFESYFYGINSSNFTYKEVSDKDREWLDIQLAKVQKHHIPIIALDYIAMDEKEKQNQDIINLQEKGFIPYVAQMELTNIGLSSKNAFKREVLIVYNGEKLENDLKAMSNAHVFASTPLEHLGYIPKLQDIHNPLPKGELSNRYAGVIIWLDKQIDDYDTLMKWAKFIISQDIKVLFLGNASIDFKHQIANDLHLFTELSAAPKDEELAISLEDDMFGFEIPPSVGYDKNIINSDEGIPLLTYTNSSGQTSTIAALTPWGGFVLDDALTGTFGEDSMWIINPFKLFKQALELQDFPAPDPTTENGKRLLFVHVDGDGSMNRVEQNPDLFSIENLRDKIISKYTIPQSISIVEAETAPYGLYPKLHKRLESAARDIYKYDYIEAATHTYSHPFYWRKIEKDPDNAHYRLAVKKYHYTIKREVLGSLNYINKQLLPKGKKKSTTVFWSGDCVPSKNVLAYLGAHNITNINGGDTFITNNRPWLSLVQPFGIELGGFYQVYTGQQNENVYTNDWLGPFWGFKKVIQTFKLTEKPRRLKPIDIYYHFYSASKTASLKALEEVYEWSLKQDIMPIFTSQYPAKVTNFYDVSLSNERNSWLLKGFNDLRTVRIPKTLGIPYIKKSKGIAGYKRSNKEYYVHLDNKKSKILTLSKRKRAQLSLVSSNARLISQKKGTQHFKGYVPMELIYRQQNGCSIKTKPDIKPQIKNKNLIYKFKNAKDVYVTQTCKR